MTRGKKMQAAIGMAVAIIMTSGLTFARAKSQEKSGAQSAKITFATPKNLGHGTVLPAGTYTLKLSEDSQNAVAGFYQHGKLVGSAPVRVEAVVGKNPTTSIRTETRENQETITSISPNGWASRLVFAEEVGSSTEPGQ